MALNVFGFIFTGRNLDPSRDRREIVQGDFRAVFVGISQLAEAPAVAQAMVGEGVELIELCGGFGPEGTAAVLNAVNGAVPVGSVGYGPGSIDAMAALFRPSP